MKVEAKLYDGKSSKQQLVEIEFTPNKEVHISPLGLRYQLDQISIATRLGNTPRTINFPDGMRAKCDDNDTIDAVVEKFNLHPTLIHKLERSWRAALVAVIVIIITVTLTLTVGADYAAKTLAHKLPQDILDSASINTLKMLDRSYLHKSNLTTAKKEKIRTLFKQLTNNNKRYKLHFRSSPKMGPNAFALPSGDVVVIDSIVYLDKDPNLYGLLGVLAHEKGHVVYKHGLQSLIKGAVVGSVLGYLSGDLSYITSALPTFILTSSYSRQFEHQADVYAKEQLHKMGISTKPLAKLFENLETFNKKKSKESNSSNEGLEWLSSHPITAKRVIYFKQD